MPRPIVLEPRLAEIEPFAKAQGYSFSPVRLASGTPAVQLIVPRLSGEPGMKLAILFFTVGDRLEVCVPNIVQLPKTGTMVLMVHQIIDAHNFARGLAHFGVDPEDGELRCSVRVLLEPGEVIKASLLARVVTALQAAVSWLGEALGEMDLARLAEEEGTPEPEWPAEPSRRKYLN